MPEEQYIPKYKVGYTINNIYSFADGEDNVEIIVGTYKSIWPFTYASIDSQLDSDYDESEPDHVIYAVYNIKYQECCWRWEKDVILSCSNQSRGKKVLNNKDVLKEIIIKRSIRQDVSKEFIKTLLLD